MKNSFIIHPLLLAVYPILHLYAINISEIDLPEIIVPAGVSVIAAALLWGVTGFVVKSKEKAALIVSVILLLFFSYGHVYYAMGSTGVLSMVWAVILIASSFFILKTAKPLSHPNRILNFISAVLVLISVVNIFSYQGEAKIGTETMKPIASRSVKELPDIYYIILDGYVNNSVLQKEYGYNNKTMVDFLTQKGFFVVPASRSNYPGSPQSIKSSLNMEYLKDPDGMGFSIKKNRVMYYLKKSGYKIVNFPSGYDITMPMELADLEVNCGGYKEFTISLMETTLLVSLKSAGVVDYIEPHINRVLCTFKKIPQVHQQFKEPVFVFAHMVAPHPPYVFGQRGRLSRRGELEKFETQENFFRTNNNWNPNFKKYYLDQLIFVNTKIKKLVNEIIATSDKNPVIIIQSDHGSGFNMWDDETKSCLTSLTGRSKRKQKAIVEERTGNFNAYYLPEEGRRRLYDTITPVNSFRVVFNVLFNANFDLLPDKVYWYNLSDVTQN